MAIFHGGPGHVPIPVTLDDIRELPLVRFKYRDWVEPPPFGPLPVPDLIPDRSPLSSLTLVQESVYEAGTQALVQTLVERAQRIDPGYSPPEFRNLRQVRTADVATARELADVLRVSPSVEYAYAVRIAPLPNVSATNDPLNAQQTHLDAPPAGVNARAVWAKGADGNGVKLVDVEHAFDGGHEDLSMTIDVVVPQPAGIALPDIGHGMAAMGIVAADDNSLGGVGISPKTKLGFASRTSVNPNDDPVLDSLAKAVGALQFGDVLLIELQAVYDDPVTQILYYAPIEVDPAVRHHVELAIASGITVIEPAGDSTYDVTAACGPNSGAIIVGGIDPGTARRDGALHPSGYGARVDCCAPAGSVVTCGGTDATKLIQGAVGSSDSYTNGFGGTSASGAIVAGAASLFQSFVLMRLGFRLPPSTVRQVLRDTGVHTAGWTAPPGPDTDQVGVVPDLDAATQRYDITIPFFIRTTPDDNGAVPRPRPGDCPDLVAHLTATPDGVDPFTLTEWTAPPPNDDAYVYVRALCDPGSDGAYVHADVYSAPPSLIPQPGRWRKVGNVVVGNVAGDGLPHSRWIPLRWRAEAARLWHGYSLIAVLGNKWNPQPHPSGIRDERETARFYQRNRIVAVRTRSWGIQVPAPPPPGKTVQAFPFNTGDSGKRDQKLLIEHELGWASRVWLRIPTYAANVPDAGAALGSYGMGIVELEPGVTAVSLRLKAGVNADCVLYVERPIGEKKKHGEIVVRRMSGDRQLGMMRAIVRPVR